MLENFELENTDHAHDVGLGTDARLLVELDGTFLGELLDTFQELLSLHGVLRLYAGEVLRREDRDVCETEVLRGCGHGIADAEDARVEKTDDVSGIGVFNDRSVLRHELLRLGECDLLSGSHMLDGHSFFEFAGADAHEGHSVSVVWVHVCLDLENESGEEVFIRRDHTFGGLVGLRSRCDLEELFKERLDAEVRDRGSEEYGSELAGKDLIKIEGVARHVEKFDVILQRLVVVVA